MVPSSGPDSAAGKRPDPEYELPPTVATSTPSEPTPAALQAADQSGLCHSEALPQLGDHEILAEIGCGGMGVVYKARERLRGEVVALKCVRSLTPTSLYRLKQEFRALADVVHPNLGTLHELRADGTTLYFTMELLEGADLLRHVRETEWGPAGQTTGAYEPPAPAPSLDTTLGLPSVREPGLSRVQLDRLRNALGQLASGLIALHAAGKLHRDLKPSNVMVTRQGRVVILDFGLAAELDRQGRHQETGRAFLGTADYAAPEQAAVLPLSPASDWYSIGAILYHILTGRTPYQGGFLHVLQAKQEYDPPAPSSLAEGVPDDLDRLCMELLHRDPDAGPDGPEISRRLQSARRSTTESGSRSAAEQPPVVYATPSPRARLIGRAAHLQTLRESYRSMRSGRGVIVFVHGRSGLGKTSLIEKFLDGLREREPAVIHSGRCYESESVPFKALDSLMDRLSEHLALAPDHLLQTLLPKDTDLLARVFPVFQCLEAVRQRPPGTDAAGERELRQ